MRLDKEMGVGESECGEREGERRRGGERVRERCCDAATSDW